MAGAPVDIALAVLRRGDEVLLQRRDRAPFAGRWELPGGKVEPDERPIEAVLREVREELGLAPRGARLLAVREHAYPQGPWVRLHAFAVEVEPARVACSAARRWVALRACDAYDVLEGTRPILAALAAEALKEEAPSDSRERP